MPRREGKPEAPDSEEPEEVQNLAVKFDKDSDNQIDLVELQEIWHKKSFGGVAQGKRVIFDLRCGGGRFVRPLKSCHGRLYRLRSCSWKSMPGSFGTRLVLLVIVRWH